MPPPDPIPRDELIEQLVKDGRMKEAVALLCEVHPTDAAQLITDLPVALREGVLLAIPIDRVADIVEELPDDVRVRAIEAMEPKEAAAILQEMDWDEEVDVLQEVDPEHAEAIMGHLGEEAPELRQLLSYDEDTAGGLMNKEFIAVPMNMTARETTLWLREKADEFADIPYTYLYVVDDSNRLGGVLSYRSLVLTSGDTPVTSLTDRESVSVPVHTTGEELVKLFRKHHYVALPVVDERGHLVGVVSQEDAHEYEVEETEEELLQISGILQGEELRDMPVFLRAGRRLVWLFLKIGLNLITASVIALHQSTISALAALAVLLPVVSDLGGSAGSQAAAVSIRELSLERVRPRDLMRVWLKELAVGLLNGVVLGLVVGLLAWLYERNMGHVGSAVGYGSLAAFAIGVNTLIAVSVGGLGPLVLKRIGFDPAIAAMPILTTFTDFCGFFLVLGLAPNFIR